MRLILALFIMCFLNITLGAQVENKSFIGKDQIQWLDKEITSLEESLVIANQDLTSNNKKASRTAHKKINISINRFSNYCASIHERVAFYKKDITDKTDDQVLDGMGGVQNYNNHKGKRLLQELDINDSQIEALEQHSKKITQLFQVIESNQSNFHPSSSLAGANLKSAQELVEVAKEFNDILTSGIVSNK